MSKKNTKTELRGRPATINQKAFIEVHNKCESVEQIVSSFRTLREMDPAKAKVYVSIRSFNLRAKGIKLKRFPRGRKASNTPTL